MNVMRKYFACLLVLVLLPLGAAAQEMQPEPPVSGPVQFTYALLADGTAEITGCEGATAELFVPAEVEGKAVTAIGAKAFYGLDGLVRVTVPEGVTVIGSEAFASCSGLETLLLPSTLTEIGDHAFYNCPRLADFTLPEGLLHIGGEAFYRAAPTRVKLPRSLASVGVNPFNGCINLKKLTMAGGNSAFEVKGGALYRKADKTLLCVPGGLDKKTFRVKQGTLAIAQSAFSRNAHFEKIVLPKTVASIGPRAFEGCDLLRTVNIPAGVREIPRMTFYLCDDLREITLPEGLVSIEERAFDCCYDLQTIRLPSTVVSIGRQAFSRCILLRSIALPQSLEVIAEDAFRDCSPELAVTAAPGSYGESWAAENGIPCGEPEEK